MQEKQSEVSQKIQRVWRLRRYHYQSEEWVSFALELKRDLGLPYGEISPSDVEKLSEGQDSVLYADVLLFSSSIARARGETQYSSKLVAAVDEFLSRRGKPQHFNLLFEKGLSFHVQGEYSLQLEHFLAAKSAALNLADETLSLANALLAMENMGLSYGSTFQKVSEMIEKLKSEDPHAMEIPVLERILDGVLLRSRFRSGKVGEAFEVGFRDWKNREDSNWKIDHVTFNAMCFAQFPYHRSHKKITEEVERLASNSPLFLQKSYRVRTLQGYLHPDDLREFRLTGFADRLYLWVWRWLKDPQSFPVQRILSIIDRAQIVKELHRLTSEDVQMIRNALRWLSLFDPNSQDIMNRFLADLKPPLDSEYSIYEIENLLLHHLTAISNDQDELAKNYLVALKQHPLWESKEVLFKDLLERVNGSGDTGSSHLELLASNIRKLVFKVKVSAGTNVVVDMSRFQIRNIVANQRILSEPMCLALELLAKKKSISCDDLVGYCFGISRFDSLIHNPRIFNLLSRLRGICGNALRFSTKSGFVFADGDWDKIQFVRRHTLAEILGRLPEWRSLLYENDQTPSEMVESGGSRESGAGLTGLRLDGFDTTDHKAVRQDGDSKEGEDRFLLKRRELEKILKKSRSTVTRLLTSWEQEGLVFREGSARSTRYRLSGRLKDLLSRNSVQNKGMLLSQESKNFLAQGEDSSEDQK